MKSSEFNKQFCDLMPEHFGFEIGSNDDGKTQFVTISEHSEIIYEKTGKREKILSEAIKFLKENF